MELVQVDSVRAEPLQAVVDGATDVVRDARPGATLDLPAELRGDDRLVTATTKRPAEEILALRAAVHVGGVEEIDALIERGLDHVAVPGGIDGHPKLLPPRPTIDTSSEPI